MISLLFAIPWVVAYLQEPFYFTVVAAQTFDNMTLLKILASYALTLPFAIYFMRRKIPLFRKNKFVFASMIVLVLFFLEQLYPVAQKSVSFYGLLENIGLLKISELLFEYSLYIEFLAVFYAVLISSIIIKSKLNSKEKFLFVWISFFVIFAGILPSYVGLFTGRAGSLLLMPISIMAAYGIILFSKNSKINYRTVIILIIVLSLPSLLAFNVRLQKQGREEGLTNVYLSENDYNALLFLKTQPEGRIIASQKISVFAPIYADQNAFFFSGRIDERLKDYEDFYTIPERRNEIIEKYSLSYVFYGDAEKQLNPAFSLENSELIYDYDTKIYKVK
jgi:hypothetical protein